MFVCSAILQVSSYNACSDQPCSNQCCNQSPCANGGTCTELWDHAKLKFNCTCAAGYIGKFCQKRRATSCKEQIEKNRQSQTGVYQLFHVTTNSLYEVFCDLTSEERFLWSLVESFSLANKKELADKALYKDYPVNQEVFIRNKFHLSLSRMHKIASHSTHVRATCNFNTEELKFTDYLRAKLTDINVIRFRLNACRRFEYINIRGYDCHNCTAYLYQADYWHVHADSYHGSQKGCQRNFPGAVISPDGEDNFGVYQTVNAVHRCSSRVDSTTQWWIGERY